MTEPLAIFLLANDRVLANVIQLLYSLRLHNFANKIFYIPFNEETYFLHKVFQSFGVERYDVDLDRIDALARRIYDRDPPAKPYPYCLGKLRKLSFLTIARPAVYLDTTRISEDDAAVSLPYMLRRYRAAGVDPLAEKIFTYPVLHYQNGGLVINTDAETTLEGLYACGEIAGGTHGRNRMMGNSLLECVVFGRRAGRASAGKAA